MLSLPYIMSVDPITELGNALDLGKPWDGPLVPDLQTLLRDQCQKKAYPSKHAALDVIRYRMSCRNRPRFLRAYRCPKCRQWHLTSAPSNRQGPD